MNNNVTPEMHDDRFEDYDTGSVVIGRESRLNGTISGVVAHRIQGRRVEGMHGGTARIVTRPEDADVIRQVNDYVDELMGNEAWLQANPDVTRARLVHGYLEDALAIKYGSVPRQVLQTSQDVTIPDPRGGAEMILDQASDVEIPVAPWLKVAAAPPPSVAVQRPVQQPQYVQPAYVPPPFVQQPQNMQQPTWYPPPGWEPPAGYYEQNPPPAHNWQLQSPPTIGTPRMSQLPLPRYDLPPVQRIPREVPQLGGMASGLTANDLLSAAGIGSLGIDGLDLTPFKAKYALLVDTTGRQHKLRWHWIQRIDDEACLLIFDSRSKSVSSEKLRRLVAVSASTLAVGETPDAIPRGLSMNLVPSIQAFRFGCFVFYYFLLAD